MNVKEMVRENNRLREQMTPFNRSYMEDMIIALRESGVNRQHAEELLLEAAHKLLEAQKRGKNAKQVFGERPEEVFREVMDSAPRRPGIDAARIRPLIPLFALSWLLGIYGIAGLIVQGQTGSPGYFGTIGLFEILIVGLGAPILVELLMKWLNSLSEDDAPKAGKFDLKALGIYVAAVVAVVAVNAVLGGRLPVFPLSPWVALLLFAAGLAGQIRFFRRK
ncbi:hypothetical protein D3C81_253490 [compost metagenome]